MVKRYLTKSLIKIHHKFGNYFIAEDGVTIAMCTQSAIAKRIKDALQKENTNILNSDQTCPHCGGKGYHSEPIGKFNSEERSYKCQQCDGTGEKRDNNQ